VTVGAPPKPPAAPVGRAGARLESLGAYLPPESLSTEDILKGCRKRIEFPLERLTGIRSRRVAGATEFSYELAEQAVADCLRRSAYHADEIDLVICCNISRCDGPNHRFAVEPTFAARLARRFGLVNAIAFDLTNACAGTFTGILIADSLICRGVIRRALIASGEYITHLTTSAQKQIEGFMDPRLACLTLGDSGVAVLLDRANRPGVGFQDLELYTLGKYHDLCVAKLSAEGGGAPIMHTDSVTSTAVTLRQAVGHAVEVLRRKQWSFDEVDALIVHQTSSTTLDGAMEEINRVVGKTVCHKGNMVYNVAERGNTATNTHLLALWERIHSGDLHPGDRVVFAVSGSGQTVGTALYVFDDLPDRLRQPPRRNGHVAAAAVEPVLHFHCRRRVRVESIGTADEPAETPVMLARAGEACLVQSARPRDEIDLVVHTGVYRSEFLAEPAVAAIAAGTLGINHEEERGGRRTLAFDILNGAGGTLNACFLVAELIGARAFSRGLVLAAETEHNRTFWPERQLGLVETASALVLEESCGDDGFTAFGCRAFPEHIDAITTYTGPRDNLPAVFHHRDPQLDECLVGCVSATVREFLGRESLTPADLKVIVPPQHPGGHGPHIARELGIDPSRLLSLEPAGDYYTSSLAYALQKIREGGLATAGDRVLFIEVAAGLQVWCALYEF
jgi:3-oxoacyl-[acyl-carrier-protein] synthase III